MSTIVTRTGKGSALTVAEMDANLNNLNTDKLELDDISVTTGVGAETSALSYNNTTGVFTFTPNSTADLAALDDFSVTTATASSGGALAYNNTTGVFTFTPADVSAASLTGITDNATASVITINDNTTEFDTNVKITSGHQLETSYISNPFSGGTITLNTSGFGSGIGLAGDTVSISGTLDLSATAVIKTSATNQNITITPSGTGAITVNGGNGINLKAASNIFTDTAATDIDITPTGQFNINSLTYFDAGIQEAIHPSTTTTGTYAPDPTNGSIHYVALSGNMTINGFSTAVAGQTITLFFDGTGGSYTLTLGASILSPGGSLALTSGGYDAVTITCIDDVTPVYIATAVNNFQ